LVLAHDRRRILHFGVTAHPTAEWTAQQLREAFPWDSAPRYLLRDRDQIFGKDFVDQVKALGIKQVLSAPRSPWQRAYVERLIGSIRRECLDHAITNSSRPPITWTSGPKSKSFVQLAAYEYWGASFGSRTGPEQIPGARVTPEFFDTVGAVPVEGRGFIPEEQEPGRNHVLV
jgi:transposase InsO family protein